MTQLIHSLRSLTQSEGDEIRVTLGRDRAGAFILFNAKLSAMSADSKDNDLLSIHAGLARPLLLRLDDNDGDAQVLEALTGYQHSQSAMRDALKEYQDASREVSKKAEVAATKTKSPPASAKKAEASEGKDGLVVSTAGGAEKATPPAKPMDSLF